jgi:hypothetical protein
VPVQFTSKSTAGNAVIVNVNNPYSEPKTVRVSITVRVNGVLTDLTSGETEIPPQTTIPVELQANGPVTFTVDQPDPLVIVVND